MKHKNRPLVIGLTGSIGMGKSTVSKLLKAEGFAVYDADKAVHALLKKGGAAVAHVAALFPGTLKRGGIDRAALGQAVFGQPNKLQRLERIIHPLIQKAEKAALRDAAHKKLRAVVLEIPLLFETGAEKRCDVTLCVFAPRTVQKARVMARPEMTEAKFRAIMKRQMPDSVKRAKADFTVPTGVDLTKTARALRRILGKLDLLS